MCCRSLIIMHNAQRRPIKIVQLTPPRTPDERPDRARGQNHSDRQHDVDYRHVFPPKVRALNESERTVNELSGISTAAIRGVMVPVIASVAAKAL